MLIDSTLRAIKGSRSASLPLFLTGTRSFSTNSITIEPILSMSCACVKLRLGPITKEARSGPEPRELRKRFEGMYFLYGQQVELVGRMWQMVFVDALAGAL